jgi:hypothetical protein
MPKTPLDIARENHAAGYASVVVAYKDKKPVEKGWQKKAIPKEELGEQRGLSRVRASLAVGS